MPITAIYMPITATFIKGNIMNFQMENEEIEYKRTTAELDDALVDIAAILNKNSNRYISQ